jgi:hypothetical protein
VVEDPRAERRVEIAEHALATALRHGRRDPGGSCDVEEVCDVGPVVLAALVEKVEAHDVPPDVQPPVPLDLDQPAGSDPGVRADRVKPEVDLGGVRAHAAHAPATVN